MINHLKKAALSIFLGILGFNVFATADTEKPLLVSKITTAAKQSKITPKQALVRLKEGNQRFLKSKRLSRNYLAQAKQAAYGQYPWAAVLNCMDSRSVPEFIFDQGLADLFTLRVAGNVLNEDILGSLEYATKVGVRLIVVLGHTSCGAVAGACDGVQLGHLDNVLDKIKPVIPSSKKETGLDNCSKPELITTIAKNNALQVAEEIRSQSPIIRDLIDKGQIGIVAGMHNVKTGEVVFFEQGRLIPADQKKDNE